jgi:hypothetical protein
MIFAIVLDCILIVFLSIALGVAFVISRKLDSLRAANADMERLSATFAESTARTEDGLSRLKLAARTNEEDRQRTEKLADDLRYLIERGDGLANRLEAAVKLARTSERVVDTAVERPAPRRTRPAVKAAESWSDRDEAALQPRSQAERQLLDALRSSGLGGNRAAGATAVGR